MDAGETAAERERILGHILTSRVYDVVQETALDPAAKLSRMLGNRVLLKREDLQPVFSFKLRGAYNRMAELSESERRNGVIAASAGNHAQGVAYSARQLGVRSLIVMPRTTPQIKVEAVRALGAEVVLHGDGFTDAKAHCDELREGSELTFIDPFDDPLVIAGQGTVGEEIVRQSHGALDVVFVPVGGGGLIAGVATYVKALLPHVRVVGVQPVESNAMQASLQAGRPVSIERPGLFADGVAVRDVGRVTFPIIRDIVDEIICVSNDEICAAIKEAFDDTRSIMEPAGALSVAGMRRYVEREGVSDLTLVAILSGANMNFDRLRFVAERAELGEAHETLLAVTIPERPGSFREFCATIGLRTITEFNYRLSGRSEAHIFVGVGTESRDDAANLVRHLNGLGYRTADLSENEMAKLHVRHMVGGRSGDVRNEWPCRFEFPERPGALMEFLDKLGGRWNISLFHYRNHGADFGRVLAAFEVPEDEREPFLDFLGTVGHPYSFEPDNEAYQLFLG